jgi:hypothetical protein
MGKRTSLAGASIIALLYFATPSIAADMPGAVLVVEEYQCPPFPPFGTEARELFDLNGCPNFFEPPVIDTPKPPDEPTPPDHPPKPPHPKPHHEPKPDHDDDHDPKHHDDHKGH